MAGLALDVREGGESTLVARLTGTDAIVIGTCKLCGFCKLAAAAWISQTSNIGT